MYRRSRNFKFWSVTWDNLIKSKVIMLSLFFSSNDRARLSTNGQPSMLCALILSSWTFSFIWSNYFPLGVPLSPFPTTLPPTMCLRILSCRIRYQNILHQRFSIAFNKPLVSCTIPKISSLVFSFHFFPTPHHKRFQFLCLSALLPSFYYHLATIIIINNPEYVAPMYTSPN